VCEIKTRPLLQGLAYILPLVGPVGLRAVAPVWQALFPYGPPMEISRTVYIWQHPIRLSHMKRASYWLSKKGPVEDPRRPGLDRPWSG